ncbi:MAG: LCP family protein [Anaerolineae bacterium]|nr:LCP family protein [Anaerolineae bacterium]
MRIPGWLFIVGILFFVAMTALCSVVSFVGARQVAIDAGEAGIEVASFRDILAAQPTSTIAPTPLPVETQIPLPTVEGETPEPTPITVAEANTDTDPLAGYEWNDPRQVRILLLGIDQRTGVNDGEKFFRTDTMMVVNIDPVRKSIGILSIPRDLWVDIPDGGPPARINTANSRGDSGGYPGGGPALAIATIEDQLGLRVDYFLRVNFDVFTTIVDLIAPNEVEICVSQVIDDPDYPDAGYGTTPVHFDPGCQKMDGERLLQYARTRATQGSDFDRARRQQEVLKAMQAQLASLDGVGNLVAQAPSIYSELADSVVTNVPLDDIIRLGLLVREIPSENIHSGVIDNLYVQLGTTETGDQILIPNYNAIRQLIQQVFNPPEDLPLAEIRQRALNENAEIAIFNNTDISGLAGQTRDWLASQGINVTAVGNVPEPTNTETVIQDYGVNTWTTRYLAELMGLPAERIRPGADGLAAKGVVIVVGSDIQSLLTSQ